MKYCLDVETITVSGQWMRKMIWFIVTVQDQGVGIVLNIC